MTIRVNHESNREWDCLVSYLFLVFVFVSGNAVRPVSCTFLCTVEFKVSINITSSNLITNLEPIALL